MKGGFRFLQTTLEIRWRFEHERLPALRWETKPNGQLHQIQACGLVDDGVTLVPAVIAQYQWSSPDHCV